ncbi:MAG: 2-phosphosulfolactate phosphatase [Marivirga sp.]|jgi:2-phosphosulfolactate phosphatase
MPENSNLSTKAIDICLTPELIHQHELAGKIVVVVDILRATSCMVTGLANGVKEIRPVASLEECRALKSLGYFTAAERNGAKAEGVDMGNSPFEYMADKVKGQKVAVSTTNGTLAISKSLAADEILIGAFLNIQAVADYLLTKSQDVLIVCAGWKGKFNLEDTLFAGALAILLKEQFTYDGDVPLAAAAMYLNMAADLEGALHKSAHAQRLAKMDVPKDISFCSQLNKYTAIPKLFGESLKTL